MMPSSMLDLVLIVLCTLVLFVKIGGGRGGEAADEVVSAPKAQNARAEAALAAKIVVSLIERHGEQVADILYPDGHREWVALDALEARFADLDGVEVVFRLTNPEVAKATAAIRRAGCECLVSFD